LHNVPLAFAFSREAAAAQLYSLKKARPRKFYGAFAVTADETGR